MTRKKTRLIWKVSLIGSFTIALIGLLIWRMWQVRGDIAQTGWETSVTASDPGSSVTATWLGISTLLFDDGETQILIDGAFTRISPLDALTFRKVSSDIATINYVLASYEMNRLAAIVPVHSHFDHAIDAGHVANRTSAVVLGSESTANIVRGAGVPVDQFQILADGETRQFGEFSIRLVASVHSPIGRNDQEIFPGIIERSLSQPARISDYRTGVAWTVILSHPRGTTLVQGSAGFIEGKLANETPDVVMLCTAGLSGLGEDYTRTFWEQTVELTGASRVISIHHDDFTAPFGEVRLMPTMLDNVVKTSNWINKLIDERGSEAKPELPLFGQPIVLY